MRTVIFALAVASLSLLATVSTDAQELKLDKEASKVTFVGSKKDGKHEGGFKKFECVAVADVETPENGSFSIDIDANSIYSDNDKLTNHLKNPDFFNVRQFKKITFKSEKVSVSDDHLEGKLTGKLKMLDKEVEVEIPVQFSLNGNVLTMTADFKIDRTKWGMNYGEGMIDNDVKIKAELVFNM